MQMTDTILPEDQPTIRVVVVVQKEATGIRSEQPWEIMVSRINAMTVCSSDPSVDNGAVIVGGRDMLIASGFRALYAAWKEYSKFRNLTTNN